MPSVLIVDDLVSIHEMLEAVITPAGFTTACAVDGEKGLAAYKAGKFDVVLADIDMRPMDGIALLKAVKLFDPAAAVIMITAYASADSAIQALKHGAFDYIAKPFKVDELIKSLRRAVEFRQAGLRQDAGASAPSPAAVGAAKTDAPDFIVGSSPKIKRLLQQVSKVAAGKAPVLIQGELGTGKRTIAEFIHETSAKDRPLVAVNCSGPSEAELRESLFGRPGGGGPLPALEQARGGVLLLQDIQALPLPLQDALAKELQGGAHDLRLVASATVDIEKLSDEGKFSEQLFYRIASLPLTVPPLRERPEDIPLLVRHFASQTFNAAFASHQIEFTQDALHLLATYHWPGNLLELRQVVSKVVGSTEHRVITAAQLPLRLNQLHDWPKLADYLAGQRRQYIQMVLHACRDDRQRAAGILGVPESDLG